MSESKKYYSFGLSPKNNFWLIALLISSFSSNIFTKVNGQNPCLDIMITDLQCIVDSTPDNPFDDRYTFAIEISGGSSGWQAEWDGGILKGNYRNKITLGPFAVADGPMFLLFTDSMDQTCANIENIIPPKCTDCTSTTIDLHSGESVSLTASTQNLWSAATYSSFQWYKDDILINGANDSTYTTNTAGIYRLRAYNDTSNQNANCYDESCCNFIINNITDSTPCLTINVGNLQCQIDATPDNPFDDTYTFDLEVTGGISGWQTEWGGEILKGSYGNEITVGPFAVADGPMFLLFTDSTDQTCANIKNITPPVCANCNDITIERCAEEKVTLSATAQSLWGNATYSIFQWYKNGVLINGATDSIYTTSAAGTYRLRAYHDASNQNANCYSESCCSFTIVENTSQIAIDDILVNNCPGMALEGNVGLNDIKSIDYQYTLLSPPVSGILTFDSIGYFNYEPTNTSCSTDQFTYQLCATNGSCCDTASVMLDLSDNVLPLLLNIPTDDTIHCDEILPLPPWVSAYDNCPSILIDVTEESTQGEDGCSLYDYTLTRTWVATDACGNTTSDNQIVDVQDITAPDIFRIYTLANGKKIVGGIMENVNQNWKTISLPIDFSSKPLIFCQVVSTNEHTPVTTRIRNVSNTQFELKLQEEAAEDNHHIREQVAWIAIEPGGQMSNDLFKTRTLSLTDAWETVNFNANYTVSPSFFGQIQTIKDNDPATLRFSNANLNSVQIQIEEETSLNSDVAHQSEMLAFMSIEQGVDMVDEKDHIFGETGSVSVDEQWITVTTKQTYYNPVVLAGIPEHLESDPGVIRIRNIKPNSFEIQFQEWNYLDGAHTFEAVSYLVMEGSIPLDASIMCESGTDNLELGKDIIAIDNCDINVALQYEETEVIDGNARQIIRTWYAKDECGNATGLSQIIPCVGVGVQLKIMLQGAMLGNEEYGLMRDDLRKKGLLPTKEPYTAMQSFGHVGAGGGEECSPEMFDITGDKAIVDWVFIELKQADNQDIVMSTTAALLQRDGHIIAPNGNEIIYFDNLPSGNYYVAIRHRNHLKAETLHPYQFNGTNIPFIDFTYQFLPTVGSVAFTENDGKNAMWAGDLNQDERTIYQGVQNDVFRMFLHIILDVLNKDYLTNFISRGYTVDDFNLDGRTIYQGPNNDRANLLFNTIFAHPNNKNNLSNFVLSTKEKIGIGETQACQFDSTLLDCDFDDDGKLNKSDADDDNDGVIDGNDTAPYNPLSDSDGDGIEDKIETQNGTNPLNACDPFQDHSVCNAQDLDGDGKYGNYPVKHDLYDEQDRNACIPNPNTSHCGCPDEDGDGYIYIRHTTKDGQEQILKITFAQWRLRQAIGDVCIGL